VVVLVQKAGEGLWIGDDILITVLEVDAGRVKLGVQAPSAVRILRAELLSRRIDGAVSLE